MIHPVDLFFVDYLEQLTVERPGRGDRWIQYLEARATAAAVAREAPTRGAAGELAMASSFMAVLEISLGNYGSAVGCLDAAYTDDTPLVGTLALPDLVEAAVRAGRRDLAERALGRLEERATTSGTALARGLLA